MKVGILGGTGKILSAIVRRLLQFGHEVVCYNRGTTGIVPGDVREFHGGRRADGAASGATMQAESFDAAIDMICYDVELIGVPL